MSTTETGPAGSKGIREAVGVFHDADSLEEAIAELQTAGFDRAEISLLAASDAVEKKLGHRYDKVGELEDDAEVPRTIFVEKDSITQGQVGIISGLAYIGAFVALGAVVASGGTLAAAAAAAVVAGGSTGLLGAVAARSIGEHHAKFIQDQLEKGGLLLWVHLRDAAHEERATRILSQHGADDVHVHELASDHVPADNPLSGLAADPFLPGSKV